jgi:hypothetical protein
MLENPININLINQNVENPNKNKIPIQLAYARVWSR